MSRTLKVTRKRKPSKKSLGHVAAQIAEQAEREKLAAQGAAQERRNRIVYGTVAARLGIITCELDLLVAACGGDLDAQSLAWLTAQAQFYRAVAAQWRARSEGTQWALAR